MYKRRLSFSLIILIILLFSSMLTQAQTTPSVSPVFECVLYRADGTYTLYFGYNNNNSVSVTVPIGTSNRFNPAPQDRGQPTEFLPGRHRNVVAINLTTPQTMVWALTNRSGTGSVNPPNQSQYCAPSTSTITLNAQTMSQTQIDLAWTAAADTVSYNLYQQTGSTWTRIGSTSDLSFQHITATCSTSYTYAVTTVGIPRTLNGVTFQPESNPATSPQATATTHVCNPADVTLSAILNGASQVDLAWGATYADVYDLEVQVNGGDWTLLLDNTTTTAYQHTDRACGTQYSYRISAINSQTTTLSAPASVNTAICAPAAISDLTATPNGQTEIDLSWTAVNGAESYRIETFNGTWNT
ncbi:MAG: hypothetical protein MUF87_21735, partial [Anaerolineae bacterium]|nr:hypothetical protein [Anaerolineae bacterium]